MGEGGEAEKPPASRDSEAGEWKLSWRRFLEFGKNILELERLVSSLKTENKELRRELRDVNGSSTN
ncbi:hypothetical protein [Methylocystis sp. S23]